MQIWSDINKMLQTDYSAHNLKNQMGAWQVVAVRKVLIRYRYQALKMFEAYGFPETTLDLLHLRVAVPNNSLMSLHGL